MKKRHSLIKKSRGGMFCLTLTSYGIMCTGWL